MDGRVRVAKAALAGRELAKVACGPGAYLVVEPEDDASGRSVVDRDVELAKRVSFIAQRRGWGRRTYTSGLSRARVSEDAEMRREETHGDIVVSSREVGGLRQR